jgi:hypothetical protein
VIRFLSCDSVTTLSALYAVTFAWFGDGALPTVIALLLVARTFCSESQCT